MSSSEDDWGKYYGVLTILEKDVDSENEETQKKKEEEWRIGSYDNSINVLLGYAPI